MVVLELRVLAGVFFARAAVWWVADSFCDLTQCLIAALLAPRGGELLR